MVLINKAKNFFLLEAHKAFKEFRPNTTEPDGVTTAPSPETAGRVRSLTTLYHSMERERVRTRTVEYYRL